MSTPGNKYDWLFSRVYRLQYGARVGVRPDTWCTHFENDQEAYASGYVEASLEALLMLDEILAQQLPVAQREELEEVHQGIQVNAWTMNQELGRLNVFGDRGEES